MIARSLEDARRIATIVKEDLAAAGWVVDYSAKCYGFEGSSDPHPRQRAQWVGFVWDTVSFRVTLPDDKLNCIMENIREVLDQGNKSIKLKSLARIVGQIQAAGPAIGSMSIFRTRVSEIADHNNF